MLGGDRIGKLTSVYRNTIVGLALDLEILLRTLATRFAIVTFNT